MRVVSSGSRVAFNASWKSSWLFRSFLSISGNTKRHFQDCNSTQSAQCVPQRGCYFTSPNPLFKREACFLSWILFIHYIYVSAMTHVILAFFDYQKAWIYPLSRFLKCILVNKELWAMIHSFHTCLSNRIIAHNSTLFQENVYVNRNDSELLIPLCFDYKMLKYLFRVTFFFSLPPYT